MKKTQLLLIGLLLSISLNLEAAFDTHLPLDKQTLKQTFKIQAMEIIDPDLPLPTINQLHLSKPNEDTLELKGNDLNNKPWLIALRPSYYEIYQADFDNNGQQDWLLHSPTYGNGLMPSSQASFILFDKAGRPQINQFEGYFDFAAKATHDLLDTNRNKKAELVYMTFNDGYWITQLYEAQHGTWKILNNTVSYTYPLYTRFTNKPNHKATIPLANRHPYLPKLNTDQVRYSGRLVDVKWADIWQSDPIRLTLKQGQQTIHCQSNDLFVQRITKQGTEIMSVFAQAEAVKQRLHDIQQQQDNIELYGERERGQCSPALLKASQRSQ